MIRGKKNFKGRSVSYYDRDLYRINGSGVRSKYFSPKDYESKEEMEEAIKAFRENKSQRKQKKKLEEEMRELSFVNIKASTPNQSSDIDLQLDDNTGNTTAIIGSSKAGKTVVMMRIFNKYYGGKKYITTLFTNNPHIISDGIYKNRKIRKNSRLLIAKGITDSKAYISAQKLLNEETNNKYNFCNMFDDIIDISRNKLLNELVLTYRNSNMSAVVLIQFSNLLSKMSRSNFNNFIFGRLNTDEAIELVLKTFLGSSELFKNNENGFPMPLREKITKYRMLTKNNGFIYYKPSNEHIDAFRLHI